MSNTAEQTELLDRSNGETRLLPEARDVDIEPSWTTTPLNVPDSKYSQLVDISSKAAGRMRAASISQEEIDKLLLDRSRILDKLEADTATLSDLRRLEYVRWSLDRIEDAKHGPQLDLVEKGIQQYERFVADLENVISQLENRATSKPRPRR